MSAREIRFCWSRPTGVRCWWMLAGCPVGSIPIWILARMLSRHICGRRSISRLDAIAITHAHADHMGGAAAVLANFRPRELWLSDTSAPEMKALLRQASELGVRVILRQAGDNFDFGGARSASLHPKPEIQRDGAMTSPW